MKEKPWPYTDGEIRTMYRDALDPRGQITIIADLCCKSKKEVEARLLKLGCELPTNTRKVGRYIKASQRVNAWTDHELDILISGAVRGATAEMIKRRLPNRSLQAIYFKARECGFPIKAKRKGERFGNDSNEIS